MIDEQSIRSVRHRFARTWVLVAIGGGMLLVLIGASVLFSFVHQVDWRVCAAPRVSLLVTQLFFLVSHCARSSLRRACPRKLAILGPSEGDVDALHQ